MGEIFNPFSLADKTILITGASSGIGRQCAIDCSKMGAVVAMIARSEERLKETLSEMEQPEKHCYYSLDLANSIGLTSVIKEIVATRGKISGVINCAGISSIIPLKMIKEELFDTLFRTNVFSAINLTKEVSLMGNYSKDGCSIIVFSSVMGCVGERGKILYSATKGALVAATRSLACELSIKGIRVNAISPGVIVTPINQDKPYIVNPEMRKMLERKHLLGLGKVTDISQTCIFLLSDASRWITGQNIIVDGGYTVQ